MKKLINKLKVFIEKFFLLHAFGILVILGLLMITSIILVIFEHSIALGMIQTSEKYSAENPNTTVHTHEIVDTIEDIYGDGIYTLINVDFFDDKYVVDESVEAESIAVIELTGRTHQFIGLGFGDKVFSTKNITEKIPEDGTPGKDIIKTGVRKPIGLQEQLDKYNKKYPNSHAEFKYIHRGIWRSQYDKTFGIIFYTVFGATGGLITFTLIGAYIVGQSDDMDDENEV